MARYFQAQDGRPTADEIADALLDFAAEQIEALAAHHASGLVLPRAFAGHAVGADTRSDLAYTLGLLYEGGRHEIAGTKLDAVVLETLRGLDGPKTHTFYSYRAAESLMRFGGYHRNDRLEGWSDAELANLREAFDSSASVEGVREGTLPRNYAVVVARAEHARQELELLEDDAILTELVDRSRALVERGAEGWIDDSNDGLGQFDIYTADIFLFAEPLATRLGPAWSTGLARVLTDVDALALPGGAIVWGRSIGALGLAMTIELAAQGTARGLVDHPGVWLARAAWTLHELRSWFSSGVIRAHQHRSTMYYRGPARRLQMTLDILGKLVQAALTLRGLGATRAAAPSEAWPPVDRYVRFGGPGAGRASEAGAWAYRDPALSFVLPLVGGFSTDYIGTPRAPGRFEVPTSGPACWVPTVHAGAKRLVAAGPPASVEHGEGELRVEYEGWAEPFAGRALEPVIAGGRRVHFRVEGRSLVVHEELSIDADPRTIDALALQVPQRSDRPLDVHFECDAPHRVDHIDVDGLAEFRSFFGELSTVHQLDIEPAQRVDIRWRVTPQLHIASTAHEHGYDTSLYEPLSDRVVTYLARAHLPAQPHRLRDTDVLHMHWPEWWQGLDLDRNARAIERLKGAGVRILWTQHNLVPHRHHDDAGTELYAMWAQAADAVIHHTEWGRERALATYEYAPHTLHRVIGHGHWGTRAELFRNTERSKIEADLGLSPCALRLAVVGAPRQEKDVQLVLDAFHACSRDDLQLLVVCIEDEDVPDDPRIRALRWNLEPEHVYYQRLAAIDALILPFDDGMLMTGTAFDAIGAGKAAVISDWPALREVLGDGAIGYGRTREDLTACLEGLSTESVAASARAMQGRQAATDWRAIADATCGLLEEMTR